MGQEDIHFLLLPMSIHSYRQRRLSVKGTVHNEICDDSSFRNFTAQDFFHFYSIRGTSRQPPNAEIRLGNFLSFRLGNSWVGSPKKGRIMVEEEKELKHPVCRFVSCPQIRKKNPNTPISFPVAFFPSHQNVEVSKSYI